MKKLGLKIFSLALSTVLMSSFAVMMTACNNDETPDDEKKKPTPPPAHTHTYSEEWTYDETDHWHVATCEHKTEISAKANHTFSGDKCTVCDFEKEPVVVESKCTCETPCAYCPVCGGCIDTTCASDECEKCGDGLTSHEFEAEFCEMVDGNDGTKFNVTDYIDNESEPPCVYVQGCMGNANGKLIFKITSDKACKATLKTRNAKNDMDTVFTDWVTVTVNDSEPIERGAVVKAPEAGHHRKRTFEWTNLGCINLIAGENTIVIEFWSGDGTFGYNMDKIALFTEAGVSLTWQEIDNSWRTPA